MPVHASIKSLDWENQFFQRNSAQLVWDDAVVLEAAQLAAFDLVQAKVDSRETARLDALQQLGFRLVEGEADLLLAVTAAERQTGIRIARPEHIPALRAAAGAAFALSRFRAPWYQAHDSARFYAQWIENAVRGTFDNQCLIAHDEQGKLQGFVSLREVGADAARIGLLATLPTAQGKGIGTKLMLAAVDWCRARRLTRLHVATQLSNLAAMRLYTRCGAAIDSTAYWLYR
ncbi:MAG: dTDP-4-amino-4,6-dideoxy-D-galactose acyltransferase [Mixta calida]|uniref:dTDP-4-amino-4,6-dideoxy-D-galactose acyltransferase n=2 Tax=Mixta calida TaxID=665913 RepID=UPI0028995E20|nr:dTDP-4-amino-4,6-dideoxy-D-galactose acyltransferase [Mixta calida]MDU2732214.1 dTDP-4-amino-4,6-dideoxy-D-galactose acyltransferase [Mixta calida]MDU3818270.1 dTDP-4-amino-4,6-dideoxy-D-galactose acyltransferase [Pantoea sp.]MDU4290676.1 dTDP-4-amino-4,6-dideoxy-D-galactose acyltransferase [Mixta calida]MDU4943281.1 dTDP-4-amino-4,6-dideoxy-D-galactose acyltransferase [Mixta calida]